MKKATYTLNPRGRGWQATVHHDGQRERRQFDTRGNARTWAETRVQCLNLEHESGYDGTLGWLIEAHLEAHYGKSKYKAKHRSTANIILRAWGEDAPVASITRATLNEWVDRQANDEGVSGSTINRRIAHLKAAFTWAAKRGYIHEVPEFDWAKEARKTRRALTHEEEARLLKVLEDDPMMHWFVEFLIDTGLRVNEATALTPSDLDGPFIVVRTGKHTNSPGGRIPMTSRVKTILDRLVTQSDSWSTPLWWHLPGYDTLCRTFRRARDTAGITNSSQVTLHSCRHTFCTRLVAAGIHLATVQKLARHKSIQTTMMYAHAAPDQTDKVLEALEQ